MSTKGNIVVDILWVIFALIAAYFSLKYDAGPTAIGVDRVIGVAFFIVSTAVALGFARQMLVNFAKLLRESAKENVHG